MLSIDSSSQARADLTRTTYASSIVAIRAANLGRLVPGLNPWTHSKSVTSAQITTIKATVDQADTLHTALWASSHLQRAYISPDEVADTFNLLGLPHAAQAVRDKYPTLITLQSGEVAEILAAHYCARHLGFRTIPRLRWKDHRDVAMRGDDVLAIRIDDPHSLHYLKCESKSRARLTTQVIQDAHSALKRDNGDPTPSTISFILSRLHDIDPTYWKALRKRIHPNYPHDTRHLLFFLCGTRSFKLIDRTLATPPPRTPTTVLILVIPDHNYFVTQTYAFANARAAR